ncbi:MAG TPA: hypothetical protein VF185_04830 [Patescibacteria group bacterium]
MRYSPFHSDLDQKYPIDKMVKPNIRELVVKGELTRYSWVHALGDTVLPDPESKAIIGIFINEAIKAGQWIDIIWKENEPPVIDVSITGILIEAAPTRIEWATLSDKLQERGFVQKVKDEEGKPKLAPTEDLLKFLDKQFKEKKIKP